MKYWRLLAFILLNTVSLCFAQSFYDERYRGWLWFEEQSQEENRSLKTPESKNDLITPAEAREEIEQFARELEELKFVMLARPTPENVRAYREKEKIMWDKALVLHDAWDMANLMYPEQRDLINNPVNVHAVKAKRAMEFETNQQKIKGLAKDFDLVLFFEPTCKYCSLLSPVLKTFSEQYGFNIEAISATGTKHEYFKTSKATGLAQSLGITAYPTVIAISHDSKTAFELIRGYVSLSELEEYSLLAIKYLEGISAQKDN